MMIFVFPQTSTNTCNKICVFPQICFPTNIHKQPRFGYALAKMRSRNEKKNKRLATQFLARAKRTTNAMDARVKTYGMWKKHADLQPVLDFLSK